MRHRRYERRSARQNALLREYSKLGYTQRGLDYAGSMVIFREYDRLKQTVIVVGREGQTKVKSIDADQDPMLCGVQA